MFGFLSILLMGANLGFPVCGGISLIVLVGIPHHAMKDYPAEPVRLLSSFSSKMNSSIVFFYRGLHSSSSMKFSPGLGESPVNVPTMSLPCRQ